MSVHTCIKIENFLTINAWKTQGRHEAHSTCLSLCIKEYFRPLKYFSQVQFSRYIHLRSIICIVKQENYQYPINNICNNMSEFIQNYCLIRGDIQLADLIFLYRWTDNVYTNTGDIKRSSPGACRQQRGGACSAAVGSKACCPS